MKKQKHLLAYHLVFLFLAVILLPLFNSITGTWEFKRRNENRTFKDSLSININHLDVFPKECEAYIKDNFSFRTPLLQLNNIIKTQYLQVSPNPKKTIIGKDGWCFSAGRALDIYEGKLNYTEEQLSNFSKEWQRRKIILDSMDIKFYWLIGPIKHYVYPEKLPLYITTRNKPRRLDQVKNQLQNSFPNLIIDPTVAFLEAKKEQKLYQKLDNHWLHSAGYIVSDLLLSAIKADFPERTFRAIPKYEWKIKKEGKGIHNRVMGLENNFELIEVPVISEALATKADLYNFPIPKGFGYPKEYELRYVNTQDTTGLKVLFIRDSFAKSVIPYAKEPFRESVFIFDFWEYKLNQPIIEKMKPDAVVFLSIEDNIGAIIRGM